MSLGCLKMTYRRLFYPPLPHYKVNAIEKLGFGTVNKLFLVFDQALFNKDVQGLQVLWRNDLNFELESVKKWNITVSLLNLIILNNKIGNFFLRMISINIFHHSMFCQNHQTSCIHLL
jgi:hypothetical protein